MKDTSLIDARSLHMVLISRNSSGVTFALTEEKAVENKPFETLLFISLSDLIDFRLKFLLEIWRVSEKVRSCPTFVKICRKDKPLLKN